MQALYGILVIFTLLAFGFAEDQNCPFGLHITKVGMCPVGYYALSDCKDRYRCYANINETCKSNDKSMKNEYRVCSEILNLECAHIFGRGFGDYGRCEPIGVFDSNHIRKKSLPTLYNQRYPFNYLLTNQNSNDLKDESDYATEERKFYY